jgi:hypothetical protein
MNERNYFDIIVDGIQNLITEGIAENMIITALTLENVLLIFCKGL